MQRILRHRRALSLQLCACVLALSFGASAAPAAPGRETRTVTPGASVTLARGVVGSATVSIESSSIAIATGEPLSVGMRARLAGPASSVQMKLKVLNPRGRLMLQRTRASYNVEAGDVEFSFQRPAGELDMKPGAYPVILTCRVSSAGHVSEETLSARILVYDAKAQRTPVVLVARISAPPLSDSEGRFTADPGEYTRARDEVRAVADHVLADSGARMTLAVAPVLLEEWKRIANGYEIVGPEGVQSVPAESSAARGYAVALSRLAAAIKTGRLELLSLGYADPNISELAAHQLLSDVGEQYARGLSSCYAALETTPSPGTIPAGGCVPPSATTLLARSEINYAIVRPHCTRDGDTTATPGAYSVTGSQLVALVGDDPAARALASGDTSATMSAAFERQLSDDPTDPITIVVTVGPGRTSVNDSLVRASEALQVQPWCRLTNAGQVARASASKRIELTSGPADKIVPADYWPEVIEARRYARGLASITATGDAGTEQAQRDSLLAESAAWSGNDAKWALAERGRTFAASSLRTTKAILDSIKVSAQPVTLSGNRGDVPASIVNGTGRDLKVRVLFRAAGNLDLVGAESRDMALKPRENFVEVPVDLVNSLSGRLTIAVMAGELQLDSATVTVRASYLDRLALIGGIVILLGIGLALIIRRVRSAETTRDNVERTNARYTDHVQHEEN